MILFREAQLGRRRKGRNKGGGEGGEGEKLGKRRILSFSRSIHFVASRVASQTSNAGFVWVIKRFISNLPYHESMTEKKSITYTYSEKKTHKKQSKYEMCNKIYLSCRDFGRPLSRRGTSRCHIFPRDSALHDHDGGQCHAGLQRPREVFPVRTRGRSRGSGSSEEELKLNKGFSRDFRE